MSLFIRIPDLCRKKSSNWKGNFSCEIMKILPKVAKAKMRKSVVFMVKERSWLIAANNFAIRGVLTCGQRYIFQKKRPYISHIYKIILQKTDKRKQLWPQQLLILWVRAQFDSFGPSWSSLIKRGFRYLSHHPYLATAKYTKNHKFEIFFSSENSSNWRKLECKQTFTIFPPFFWHFC